MRTLTRLAVAVMAAATLAAAAPQRSAVPSKPDDKAIRHVLNRIAFGARPGDVERVREQGLASYIERQLRPEKIEDSAMQRRLASFATLHLSSRDLATEYFAPALIARRNATLSLPYPPTKRSGTGRTTPTPGPATHYPATPTPPSSPRP